MLQRQYNFHGIQNELIPLILGPLLTLDNPDLDCYNSNESIHQCDTSTKSGSCVISDTISENKIIRLCDNEMIYSELYVNMYRLNNYTTFDVHCNRSLCNDQSTLREVKRIMFKYNITKTPDGRLDGSRLIISILLMIMMIFSLLLNRF